MYIVTAGAARHRRAHGGARRRDRRSTADDAEAPYEQWEFGAEVVRLDASGMGLRFVGIPLVLRITHRGQPEPDQPARLVAMHAA